MTARMLFTVCLLGTAGLSGSAAGADTAMPSTQRLAAGSAAVASCGSLSGVASDFTISAGSVIAVQLSNLPASCNGGNVTVTVTNSSTSLGSGGPVAVSSGTATVPISPGVPTANVTHVHLVIVGP